MKPKYIVAGNWKLNKGPSETKSFIVELSKHLDALSVNKIDIIIAPPFVSLSAAKSDNLYIAAQNVYWEDSGAFTGEVSAPMLREFDIRYCIAGHSERRMHFHETDRMINLKVIALLRNKIIPILCIGEKAEERKAGLMHNVVEFQLSAALFGAELNSAEDIVIAYEPIWAIGTGNVASPQQAEDMHETIRKYLKKQYGSEIGCGIRILYGGSVNTKNIEGLIAQNEINGALIGGASLDINKFLDIIKCVRQKEK